VLHYLYMFVVAVTEISNSREVGVASSNLEVYSSSDFFAVGVFGVIVVIGLLVGWKAYMRIKEL
jgi:hypothetical protein